MTCCCGTIGGITSLNAPGTCYYGISHAITDQHNIIVGLVNLNILFINSSLNMYTDLSSSNSKSIVSELIRSSKVRSYLLQMSAPNARYSPLTNFPRFFEPFRPLHPNVSMSIIHFLNATFS